MFTGSDIDVESLSWATKNVALNSDYSNHIRLLLTEDCNELQRALLNYISSESSVLEFKVGKGQNVKYGEVITFPDSVENDDGNDDGDEGMEKQNRVSMLSDPRNHSPITRFLISQYCSHVGTDESISTSVRTTATVRSPPSPLPSLTPPCTGPVRAALIASGIQEAVAVRRLERLFVRNNAHLLEHSEAREKECSGSKNGGCCAISRRESKHMTADDEHDNEKEENESECQDQDVDENFFYSACMTNPPFYDEDEKVRRFPSFYCCVAFFAPPDLNYFTVAKYNTVFTASNDCD